MRWRPGTGFLLIRIAVSLWALLGTATATTAQAGTAAEGVLGKPQTVHHATPRPQPTHTPQQAGTTRTNTAVTRTQAPPTLSTPHIATTTPRGTTTAPAGIPAPGTTSTPSGNRFPRTPTTSTAPVLPSTPATGAGTPKTSTTPGAATGLLPGRTTALGPVKHEHTSISSVAIVAAALATLLILLCVLWGAARWYAYEPHWTVSLRHSLAEAGLRMSATWEELGDWARLGR